MNTIVLFLLTFVPASPQGYTLEGNQIHFHYPEKMRGLEVYVSGNFNGWSKETEWRMEYTEGQGYTLTKPISSIRKPGKSFYEFTFRVNGELLDADHSASNIIHCAGYGSRYTIHF